MGITIPEGWFDDGIHLVRHACRGLCRFLLFGAGYMWGAMYMKHS